MIVILIISALFVAVKAVFGLLPSLPPLPEFLTTGIAWFSDTIGDVVGFVSYIYTPEMFVFGITAVLVMMNFSHVYYFAMFIARKLPLGIK